MQCCHIVLILTGPEAPGRSSTISGRRLVVDVKRRRDLFPLATLLLLLLLLFFVCLFFLLLQVAC